MGFFDRNFPYLSGNPSTLEAKIVPETVLIHRSLVVADPLPDVTGYTWTLASVLGDLLATAQAHFGDRDVTYCLLGLEFTETGPQVWFPGDRKNVVIQLSLNSLTNNQSALYELAHECVHLLSPRPSVGANVLEEGLATFFSVHQMVLQYGEGWWNNKPSAVNYHVAASYVQSLLALDVDIIKKLRQEEPHISSITSGMILRHCPSAPEALAQSLTAEFVGHKKT